MLSKANFLMLDEPTNHLDVQAKEALKTALMAFVGTVLLVSHEESFYRDWTQRVISIEKNKPVMDRLQAGGIFSLSSNSVDWRYNFSNNNEN